MSTGSEHNKQKKQKANSHDEFQGCILDNDDDNDDEIEPDMPAANQYKNMLLSPSTYKKEQNYNDFSHAGRD